MKDYAIITARTSSSRLNGKILKNIKNNKKSIDILIERAKKLDLPIVLATSNSKSDLALINYVKNKYKIGIFKGDLNNTIKRWYKCMKKYKIKNACLIDGDDLAFDYKSYSEALKLIKRCGNNEALILKDNKKIITGVFTKVINLKAMKILNDIFNNKIVDTIFRL
jgi:spore coat polysaccharide biosynthesis protein SpsF